MKIKKNKIGWLIFTLVITLGYFGLMIYQLINKNFDPMNLIMILFVIDSLLNCIEKK
ncbi:MAG: hypothetical protein IJK66_05990 [Bacilli bacterium]|nr:hypothetical protein [Bacilli bacterium]